MGIFSTKQSFLKTRSRNTLGRWDPIHFYASWSLLRRNTEELLYPSHKIQFHWQRDRYVNRRIGMLRKGQKNYPKNHKRKLAISKAAFNWMSSRIPLI